MALTRREAFKVAFLLRCADQGLTIAETTERVKTAADRLEKEAILDTITSLAKYIGGKGVDLGESAVGSALSYGVPAALIAPPALGALAGYGAAKLTGGNDESTDDLKTQEKVDAYRRAREMTLASTQQALREQEARSKPRRSFRDLV